MIVGAACPSPPPRTVVIALCALLATVCAVWSVSSISLLPPGISPRQMDIAAADARIAVDRNKPLIGDGQATEYDYETIQTRAVLVRDARDHRAGAEGDRAARRDQPRRHRRQHAGHQRRADRLHRARQRAPGRPDRRRRQALPPRGAGGPDAADDRRLHAGADGRRGAAARERRAAGRAGLSRRRRPRRGRRSRQAGRPHPARAGPRRDGQQRHPGADRRPHVHLRLRRQPRAVAAGRLRAAPAARRAGAAAE